MMRNNIKIKLILFLFLFPIFFDVSYSENKNSKLISLVESELKLFDKKTPGIGVLIIKNSETLIKKGYGYANVKLNKKIDNKSIFALASVSKHFTAAAIIKLINEGRLSLEDRVVYYLPKELSFLSRKLKVKNLLFHTSSLSDYLNDKSMNLTNEINKNNLIVDDKFVIEYLKKNKIKEDEIGKFFNYSNSNYVLLSILIENISKMTFEDYMNIIFKDAKMETAEIHSIPYVHKNEVQGYSDYPYFSELRNQINYITKGDDGARLSLDDFENWIYYISKKNPFYLEKFKTSGTLDDGSKIKSGQKVGYGYGMRIGKIGNYECIFHRGYIDGAQALFVYSEKLNTFIVILANSSSFFLDNIAKRIFDKLVL